QSGLFEVSRQLRGKRNFLQDTWLLGEGISSPVLSRLSEQLELHSYPVGYEFATKSTTALFLVKQGQAQLFDGSNLLESVSEGEFFGEDTFFGIPYLFGVRSEDPVEVYQIPQDAIRDIPIVRWKLFETMRRRRRMLLTPFQNGGTILTWKDGYSVMNSEMDKQHQLIFKHASQLYETIDRQMSRRDIENALSALIECTISHFNMEEALMEEADFPGLERQREQHQSFATRISCSQKAFMDGRQELDMDFLDLYQDWFIFHVLTDDRQYTNYVNENE
ncbi:MAG: bacteriohemerythrin, partial [SAR324 cluster bacterium]|nr:bacteriohemerythrin [SAR324 cluster bacterium]